ITEVAAASGGAQAAAVFATSSMQHDHDGAAGDLPRGGPAPMADIRSGACSTESNPAEELAVDPNKFLFGLSLRGRIRLCARRPRRRPDLRLRNDGTRSPPRWRC